MKLRDAYIHATFEQQRWLNDITRQIEEIREETADILSKRQTLIGQARLDSCHRYRAT